MALTAAIHVGVSLGNASLENTLRDTLDRIAGRAQIQVAGAAGVPEDLLEKVGSLDCVSDAAATILRPAPVLLPGETAIAFLGVDLLEDDRFRDYAIEGSVGSDGGFEDALILLAQPDSVLVTRELAERHGLVEGSVVPVWTGREDRKLVVRGLLENTEITGAYGGNLAVMDLYAAQHVFSRRGFFDRIDVRVEPHSSIEACTMAIEGALNGHFEVAATARASGSTRAFGVMYAAIVDVSTLLAVLAALLLIHHASAVGVAQREKEIAILLSLGADEKRIRRFILAEAALAGALAGTLGLVIGCAAAHPLTGALQDVLRSARGVVVKSGELEIAPLWAAGTILATATVALAGAWGAANAAARVPPIQLAGGRRFSERGERGSKTALVQAALVGGAALVVQHLWTDSASIYVCLPLALAALWRLARAMEPSLFQLIAPPIGKLWPIAGPLAVHSLGRERRRLRGPLLAIAFSVAIIGTVTSVTSSYADRFLTWASERIRMDYIVHSAPSLSEHGALLPPETYRQLLAADFVAEAARLSRVNGRAAGRPATLVAVDLRIWNRMAGLPEPKGKTSATVTQNFATLAGIEAGELFTIETPSGPFEMRADQVVEDYTSESGAIYFDWTVYEQLFGIDTVEMIGIALESSVDRERAREQISALLPPRVPVLILDPSQIVAHICGMVSRWHRASFVQAVAVIPIAVLTVASFLVVSLLSKRKQLAILEALGASPKEIRRCIWAEAAVLGLAGSLLGLALGALLESFVLRSIQQTLLGFHLPFDFDWRLTLGLLAAGPAGALAAACIPAHAIGRKSLVGRLSDE